MGFGGRLVVMTGAVAVLVATAPAAAHAYGQGDCDAAFGAGNTATRYDVNVDTGDVGQVDFGDNPHIGGVPRGNGVVCFAKNGGVKVMGRYFSDRFCPGSSHARVQIDIFFRTSSGGTAKAGSTTTRSFVGCNAENRYVERVGSYPGRRYVSARLRLYSKTGSFNYNTPFTKRFDRTYARGAQ